MSLVRIVTTPHPSTTQRVELDGALYTIALRWSQRGEAWHLDLADADGAVLLSGLRLVTAIPLLYRFRYIEGMPPGELWFFDVRGQAATPTLEDMGDRFQLLYEPSGDQAAP